MNEGIFTARCVKGKIIFSYPDDLYKYAIENDETEIVVYVEQSVKTSEKQKMYNYWHGPLLAAAIEGYTRAGHEGVDKVVADYLLCALFAKGFVKKRDGSFEPYVLSKARMDKARLLKLIQDALFFLESELGQTVPDAEEYKMMQLTGRKLKKIITQNPNGNNK